MNRRNTIGAAVLAALTLAVGSAPTAAQQHCSGPQIGTWKLKSVVSVDMKSGQKSEEYGDHPSGFINYGSDCRVSVIIIADGRKAPANLIPTDAERVDLYNGLTAYAGRYDIKGDIVSHHIEASWNQVWTGATQLRRFKVDGGTLDIKTQGQKSPMTGRESVTELIWTKVE